MLGGAKKKKKKKKKRKKKKQKKTPRDWQCFMSNEGNKSVNKLDF